MIDSPIEVFNRSAGPMKTCMFAKEVKGVDTDFAMFGTPSFCAALVLQLPC